MDQAYFFFGCTFDLKSLGGNAYAHAQCHTLCVLRRLRRACLGACQTGLSKTTAKKTAVRKRATPQVIFSNKELQRITAMYFLVNCEQDWEASDHCSISVVSSRKLAKDNHDNVSLSILAFKQQPGNSQGILSQETIRTILRLPDEEQEGPRDLH